DRPAPAATHGTASSPPSSITARAPAISSRSCRGWTSICGGLKPRALQPDQQRAYRAPHAAIGFDAQLMRALDMEVDEFRRAARYRDARASQFEFPGFADQVLA